MLPRVEAMKAKAFEAGKKNERSRIARMLRRSDVATVLSLIDKTR